MSVGLNNISVGNQIAVKYFATKDGSGQDLVFMSGIVSINIAGNTVAPNVITDVLVILFPVNSTFDGPLWTYDTQHPVYVVPSASLADIATALPFSVVPRWSIFSCTSDIKPNPYLSNSTWSDALYYYNFQLISAGTLIVQSSGTI